MNDEQIDLNEETQDPDGNRALLGWLTGMMEQSMPQDEMMEEGMEGEAMEGQQTPEMGQGETVAKEQPEVQTAELEGKFEQFKEDINKTIDDKISQIGEMIKQALAEDDEKE